MDLLLIERAKRKDKNAFSKLIIKYEISMYRAARAILINDEDIADAMQNTILKCWESIDTLREEKYFKTWLMRILINECYMLMRKNKEFLVENKMLEKSYIDYGYVSVEWRELISCMDEPLRTVIILHYVEGFKIKEIAKILNIKESTVKDRLYRARKQYEKRCLRYDNKKGDCYA